MTVFVVRDGKLVRRDLVTTRPPARSHLPAPMLSRIEPFESPVTGKEITSWRDRDRDMKAAGAVDPRDLPKQMKRGRAAQQREAKNARRSEPDFQWRSPD